MTTPLTTASQKSVPTYSRKPHLEQPVSRPSTPYTSKHNTSPLPQSLLSQKHPVSHHPLRSQQHTPSPQTISQQKFFPGQRSSSLPFDTNRKLSPPSRLQSNQSPHMSKDSLLTRAAHKLIRKRQFRFSIGADVELLRLVINHNPYAAAHGDRIRKWKTVSDILREACIDIDFRRARDRTSLLIGQWRNQEFGLLRRGGGENQAGQAEKERLVDIVSKMEHAACPRGFPLGWRMSQHYARTNTFASPKPPLPLRLPTYSPYTRKVTTNAGFHHLSKFQDSTTRSLPSNIPNTSSFTANDSPQNPVLPSLWTQLKKFTTASMLNSPKTLVKTRNEKQLEPHSAHPLSSSAALAYEDSHRKSNLASMGVISHQQTKATPSSGNCVQSSLSRPVTQTMEGTPYVKKIVNSSLRNIASDKCFRLKADGIDYIKAHLEDLEHYETAEKLHASLNKIDNTLEQLLIVMEKKQKLEESWLEWQKEVEKKLGQQSKTAEHNETV